MHERRGALTVVGLGLQVPAHVTTETRACLERADAVLYLVGDPVAATWLEHVNAKARSLHQFYEPGMPRVRTYAAIVDEILSEVRAGAATCVAFYGHPGVFVNPSHEAVRRARAEGFSARMLPAVSAEDCLYADLGVDPCAAGLQSFEATDLVLRLRPVDVSAALILWQVGVVGNVDYAPHGDVSRLPLLVEHLLRFYAREHRVVLYEASLYPVCGPLIEELPLADLATAEVSPMTTLFVPPAVRPPVDPVSRARLGLQAPAAAGAAARA